MKSMSKSSLPYLSITSLGKLPCNLLIRGGESKEMAQ